MRKQAEEFKALLFEFHVFWNEFNALPTFRRSMMLRKAALVTFLVRFFRD
jgi:hypothetical protein